MSPTDIRDIRDVELLVHSFYNKVRTNNILSPIFNDTMQVDWNQHLPKMVSFWASLLLGTREYAGNPMTIHVQISKLTRMSEVEFSEWLMLFNQTVDEHFVGPSADEAKIRAANIARLMLHKIEQG